MVSTNDVVVSEAPVAPADAKLVAEQIKSISDEEFEKAQKTFQSGKKNLFLNKYDESVNNIADACEIYSAKYGEFDSKCAEVYFFYGRALLELARVENTVLGNALSGVPDDSGAVNDSRYGNPDEVPAEEKKEISEQVIDALCDTNEQKKEAEGETAAVENGEAKKEEEKKDEEKKDEEKKDGEKKEDEKKRRKNRRKERRTERRKKKEEVAVEAKKDEAKEAAEVEEKKETNGDSVVEKKEGEEASKNEERKSPNCSEEG